MGLSLFAGTETILGRKCHRFVNGGDITRLTMWVHYRRIGKKYQRLVEYVPIQYELLHFNAKGTLITWHKIEYNSYKSTLAKCDVGEIFNVNDEGNIPIKFGYKFYIFTSFFLLDDR